MNGTNCPPPMAAPHPGPPLLLTTPGRGCLHYAASSQPQAPTQTPISDATNKQWWRLLFKLPPTTFLNTSAGEHSTAWAGGTGFLFPQERKSLQFCFFSFLYVLLLFSFISVDYVSKQLFWYSIKPAQMLVTQIWDQMRHLWVSEIWEDIKYQKMPHSKQYMFDLFVIVVGITVCVIYVRLKIKL